MKEETDNLLAADHGDLDKVLAKLCAAFNTENVGQILTNLDMFWARLAMHIRAEHLHLFPALLRSGKSKNHSRKTDVPAFGTVADVIENLKKDHNFFMTELAAAVRQMRRLSEIDDIGSQTSFLSIREKITAVRRRLETHNELEETAVYRWADDFLDPAELTVLNEKMHKELDNLPPRFRKQ